MRILFSARRRLVRALIQHSCTSQYRSSFHHSTFFSSANMPTIETHAMASSSGDLNNTQAARTFVELEPDLSYLGRTLATPSSEDAEEIREAYRPFVLDDEISSNDWVAKLELSTAMRMVEQELKSTGGDRLKVLVLFGSMRSR